MPYAHALLYIFHNTYFGSQTIIVFFIYIYQYDLILDVYQPILYITYIYICIVLFTVLMYL